MLVFSQPLNNHTCIKYETPGNNQTYSLFKRPEASMDYMAQQVAFPT